jgi:HD-GYP domain-containing protein (c-di-GMP phosphodiesterase class II)
MEHADFSFCTYSNRFDKLHALRTADLTYKIAIQARLPKDLALRYMDAAYWHDVGKIFIPSRLLDKPGPLTEREYDIVCSHTFKGSDYIEASKMPNSRLRADVALYHHERLNGSGYLGLRGKAISKAARIVAIADAYDAMTHDRPYRKAMFPHEAIKELLKHNSLFYDERIVYLLLKVLLKTADQARTRRKKS